MILQSSKNIPFTLVGATEGKPGYCKEGQSADDVDGRINRFNFFIFFSFCFLNLKLILFKYCFLLCEI